MNELKIICGIISAFFTGISVGCLIAAGVHNSIYKRRKSPREVTTFKATAQDLLKKTKHVTPFLGCFEEARPLPITEREADAYRQLLERRATDILLNELERAGTIHYDIRTSDAAEFRCQRVRCVAKLDVVMPEKEAET